MEVVCECTRVSSAAPAASFKSVCRKSEIAKPSMLAKRSVRRYMTTERLLNTSAGDIEISRGFEGKADAQTARQALQTGCLLAVHHLFHGCRPMNRLKPNRMGTSTTGRTVVGSGGSDSNWNRKQTKTSQHRLPGDEGVQLRGSREIYFDRPV